ncbi:MAG: 50S ribosomal protein L9 [Prevotellaceae bacterium]|jgi:large subunit ribosomal protein L9|nr:50S ribosomal protein L9 [Prevotellaceae bacterium]
MEIILKQDVPNVGHKDDLVTVKNGYGANYLIPKGYAIMATSSAKKVLAENLKQRAHKEAKIRKDATDLAAKLDGKQFKLATKVSSTGKIFGSVNNIQVADVLAAAGFEIDRRNIVLAGEGHIKEVGEYEAVIKIYREIKANIKVEIVGEE